MLVHSICPFFARLREVGMRRFGAQATWSPFFETFENNISKFQKILETIPHWHVDAYYTCVKFHETSKMPVHCMEHQDALFFIKHLLWLTHAWVKPCVKTNDSSRKRRDKVSRSGAWWWLVVGLSGGMGMDDAGSGHHARLFQRLPFLIAQQWGCGR